MRRRLDDLHLAAEIDSWHTERQAEGVRIVDVIAIHPLLADAGGPGRQLHLARVQPAGEIHVVVQRAGVPDA
jgi:hypothetical protein